jgi:hypothetical protein
MLQSGSKPILLKDVFIFITNFGDEKVLPSRRMTKFVGFYF